MKAIFPEKFPVPRFKITMQMIITFFVWYCWQCILYSSFFKFYFKIAHCPAGVIAAEPSRSLWAVWSFSAHLFPSGPNLSGTSSSLSTLTSFPSIANPVIQHEYMFHYISKLSLQHIQTASSAIQENFPHWITHICWCIFRLSRNI